MIKSFTVIVWRYVKNMWQDSAKWLQEEEEEDQLSGTTVNRQIFEGCRSCEQKIWDLFPSNISHIRSIFFRKLTSTRAHSQHDFLNMHDAKIWWKLVLTLHRVKDARPRRRVCWRPLCCEVRRAGGSEESGNNNIFHLMVWSVTVMRWE